MAQMPHHWAWMEATSGGTFKGRTRSPHLKQLDQAVAAYEQEQSDRVKQMIKVALDRWRFEQKRQGKDWTKSVRNQPHKHFPSGAVTHLYRAVNGDKRQLTKAELEAMQWMAREQAMALQRQFAGVQLQFKGSTVVGMAQNAGSAYQKFKTGSATIKEVGTTTRGLVKTGQELAKGIKSVAANGPTPPGGYTGSGPIKDALKKLCTPAGLNPDQVFKTLNLGGVDKFAADMAPMVGAIKSGATAIVEWIKVIKSEFDQDAQRKARFAFQPGDPAAALDAVVALLEQEQKTHIGKASIATTGFAIKSFAALDGGAISGPVGGAVEALATIIQTIVEYVRDYQEVQAANEALRLGALNFDLFTISPTLGCYFLAVQDHSTIINFAIADYGTPNAVHDIEALINKIRPTLAHTQRFILASRFEVPGMEKQKGIAQETYGHKSGFSKLAATPAAVMASIDEGIEKHVGKGAPAKIVVDQSRIVGFGHQGNGGFGPSPKRR